MMPGGKKPITTPAMDEIIKDVYPAEGGPKTVKAINEKFGTNYNLSQIHSRARVLHLSAPSAQGGSLDPRYLNNIETEKPVGIYRIIEYTGYKQKDVLFKGHHYYLVRCIKCWSERRMMQETIYQAKRKGTQNCAKCSREQKLTSAQERALEKKEEDRKRILFEQSMRIMPVTDLLYIPFEKRFDSQRMI